MKVIFCSSEVYPYAKTGGLADVCGSLPIALAKLGISVDIFLPGYGFIDRKKYRFKPVRDGISCVEYSERAHVYLIENQKYYSRSRLYGDSKGDYPDNLERFQYFSQSVLDFVNERQQAVDIIHCHDWQTALIPVYLKEKYSRSYVLKRIKSVLTIHNLAYQGVFPQHEFVKTGLGHRLFNIDGFEYYGKANLLKAGIIFADKVTTVSPQYAEEIQTKEFGCGLEGVLKNRKDGIAGILNGIDYDIWNPETDPHLAMNYSPDNYKEGKRANKIRLQKESGLPVDPDIPVFGFVGRLSHQKGIDLIIHAISHWPEDLPAQFIFQGTGDIEYEEQLFKCQSRYPRQVYFHSTFDEAMAHFIYAGSDILMMPSQFEPCGLSQMISMRYGTVPLVYPTGGLADTVDRSKGIIFQNNTEKGFLQALQGSVEIYAEKEHFAQMIAECFKSDFSWEQSAQKYQELYQWLLSA